MLLFIWLENDFLVDFVVVIVVVVNQALPTIYTQCEITKLLEMGSIGLQRSFGIRVLTMFKYHQKCVFGENITYTDTHIYDMCACDDSKKIVGGGLRCNCHCYDYTRDEFPRLEFAIELKTYS